MPSTAMLAAHQGQNRSRGFPFRSASEMTLMPFCSTDIDSLGRTATSVAIAPSSHQLNAERAQKILLPAIGSEIFELFVCRTGGRTRPRYRIGRCPVREQDGVRPAHASGQAREVGADVHVARAAGVDRLHLDR